MFKNLALTAVAALSFAPPSLARPTGENGDVIAIEVLGGWREDGRGHVAALKMTLAHGWKTYWRAPGDAGIPPRFDWTGSENIASIVPHWPVPEIFNQNGMRSIGYDNEVIIPLHITKEWRGNAAHLRADIEMGICEEICIPAFVSINAALPPQGRADAEIQAALADRPMTESEARVGAVTCSVRPLDDGLGLTVTVTMPPMARGEAAAIETADPTIWVAEPQLSRSGDILTAQTELVRHDARPFALDRSGVRMTVFGAGKAVDIQGCDAG